MRTRPLLLLPLLGMTACYTLMAARPGTLSPATAMIAPAQRGEIWQRAIIALLDAGYVPELLNETACFIKARQREDLMPDATTRTTAIVTIGTNGALRVEVAGAGYFSSDAALAASIHQKQDDLLRQILAAPPAPPAAVPPGGL